MEIKRNIIGIDPGNSGAVCVWTDVGYMVTHKMPETPTDLLELLTGYEYNSICYLEKVSGFGPYMKSVSMFNFGVGYGHIEMCLIALKIPTEAVQPQKWMKALGVGSKGESSTTEWKNKLKAKAQQLYPDIKITLDTADAVLICHYGKQCQSK